MLDRKVAIHELARVNPRSKRLIERARGRRWRRGRSFRSPCRSRGSGRDKQRGIRRSSIWIGHRSPQTLHLNMAGQSASGSGKPPCSSRQVAAFIASFHITETQITSIPMHRVERLCALKSAETRATGHSQMRTSAMLYPPGENSLYTAES